MAVGAEVVRVEKGEWTTYLRDGIERRRFICGSLFDEDCWRYCRRRCGGKYDAYFAGALTNGKIKLAIIIEIACHQPFGERSGLVDDQWRECAVAISTQETE